MQKMDEKQYFTTKSTTDSFLVTTKRPQQCCGRCCGRPQQLALVVVDFLVFYMSCCGRPQQACGPQQNELAFPQQSLR